MCVYLITVPTCINPYTKFKIDYRQLRYVNMYIGYVRIFQKRGQLVAHL